MFRSALFSIVSVFLISSASAGLTVEDQLETIFKSNTFTSTTTAQIIGTTVTDSTSGIANIIGPGDVIEMVMAFNGTSESDTDYAALLFRATGTALTSTADHGGFGSTFGQKTTVGVQEGFDYVTPTFSFNAEGLAGTGNNNVAYLVTSDDNIFNGKTFAQIEASSSSVNLVATYALDASSNLIFDSLATGATSGDSFATATASNVQVSFTLNLAQTGILSAQSGNFSAVGGGAYSSIAISSSTTTLLNGSNFDSTDTIHSFGPSSVGLEFNTTFAVPEPSSFLALSALSIVGLGYRRRHRNN